MKLFPIELRCACGEHWRVSVPKHLQTVEYARYALADWKKKHGAHLSNAADIEKLLQEAQP